jgi:Ca-activated chloride channel homolog
MLLPRLALLSSALAIGVVVSAQQPTFAVRITSPVEDAYLSGAIRLVAVIEPANQTSQVKEVVFFADGRRICSVTKQPFQCEWDAGDHVIEHTIRVTAEASRGGRVAATVQTKGVKFAEAVDVDVVQVTAVVSDGNRFITNLKAQDFKIYDNDRLQKITNFQSENISLELVAALDVSSSMKEALPKVKESAKRFLEGLRSGDMVTLLAFNDLIYTLSPRTKDQAQRLQAIDRMRAWGGTALYDVVVDGLNRLGRQPGRRSMLLFSDGDDQSSHASLDTAMARAEGSDATIYVIGQGRAIRARDLQSILTRFATISGGRAFFTEDVSRLDRFFEEILEDLSNQYLLSYPYPDVERDGQWHRIRVEVEGGYHVRTRPGYRLMRD